MQKGKLTVIVRTVSFPFVVGSDSWLVLVPVWCVVAVAAFAYHAHAIHVDCALANLCFLAEASAPHT